MAYGKLKSDNESKIDVRMYVVAVVINNNNKYNINCNNKVD